ncbi:MAG TPA: GNAT family N-acetyltransferase [Ktedonobacteraceae bacterium]|nr:GNAT family N-acetyltransferase [Ktedonobacteraceae bacterium]
MARTTEQRLLQKHALTPKELADLEHLTAICNTYESLLMRLDHNMLKLPLLPTNDFFLLYRDEQLIGCLLLDRYHSDVKEVMIAVHPDFRRQGIARRLLAVAREECLSRGIRRMLFVCETLSKSGQAFIRSMKAGREFAEHFMLLQDFQPHGQFDDHLLFREALFDDLDALATILAADFNDSKERAKQHVRRSWERPAQQFYIATYGEEDVGCAEPVGTLRVEETPDNFAIYGFFVRPEYRGRGHGRQMLEEIILTLRARHTWPIALDVDSNNFTALNLYLSCGFAIDRTYEYYAFALE